MSYGVFQEYFSDAWPLEGSHSLTGIVGTTFNGVIYISMPFLFALFARRWARWRQIAALVGTVLACVGFASSAFATKDWHLVLLQGVVAGLGCAFMYSPTTLSLGEWFTGHHRALAYAIVLAWKNMVGSGCPFLFRELLDRYGLRTTLLIWTALLGGTGLLSIAMITTHPSILSNNEQRPRKVPWTFLKHQTIYVYSVAILLQSAGYGIPQSYINTYAREITSLSQTYSTLLLTLFNIPGIASSCFFGFLSDNKHWSFSAASTTSVSAIFSAMAVFLLWGLTSPGSTALLILFSLVFGFFSSGYSSTWGGILNQMETEAARTNEALDTGVVYGVLNGVRGVGYVIGGLVAVPLLRVEGDDKLQGFAYGTSYGPLIIFTGISSAFGAMGLFWKLTSIRLPGCCWTWRPNITTVPGAALHTAIRRRLLKAKMRLYGTIAQ